MTTRILLVRHGQSQGNAESRFGGHTATPLSELGRAQAEATARALTAEGGTAIYSSDLLRAVETARPLADALGLEIGRPEALRERNVGRMEGLTFEEATAQFPAEYAALLRRDFEHVLQGGESYRQMLDRAARSTPAFKSTAAAQLPSSPTPARSASSSYTSWARSTRRRSAPSGSKHQTVVFHASSFAPTTSSVS